VTFIPPSQRLLTHKRAGPRDRNAPQQTKRSWRIAFFEWANPTISATRPGNEILPIECDDKNLNVYPEEATEIHGTVSTVAAPIGSNLRDTTQRSDFNSNPVETLNVGDFSHA